ncbi:tetratricopeptide repeat protein [Hamadaea tsunoensis]|uniref:tetratricopeptide repeat protein n=1 Tax=Hamadaea tsunoensis TaxID=53368 RepID=UPI000412ECAD|nr:tetratricopeptide repeat protein [Hamadaea tsunoensis]
MATNLYSLTCYALLRAIESDLRALIVRYCGDHPAEQVLGAELRAKALKRQANERRDADGATTAVLVGYLDFGDANALRSRWAASFPEDLRAALDKLHSALDRAVPIRNRVAHARPLDIDDLSSLIELADRLMLVPGFDWPELTATHRRLKDEPSYVLGLRSDLRADTQSTVFHNLPPADFDETGLLGRRQLRSELLAELLKGPWPVVSILGEGGLGKTALALQVVYDLIDHPSCPFQIVVWTTAKTEMLTTSEIRRIPGAIQDSMGVFERAAADLAGASAGDPIAEVRDYLSSFRMLLVLDNLETVMDDRILDFITHVPSGSKVLITSRIGVRDQRGINLDPLSEGEATHLLRQLARVRHVTALTGLSSDVASGYVQRMNRHPGYIKWFVTGVEVSRESPEKLLRNEGLVLDYCMGHVFEQLSEDARSLLRSLLIATGSHTRAELAFLNDFDSMRTDAAAFELLRTNFVTQLSAGPGRSALTLSDFARKYVQRHHAPSPHEYRLVTARQQHLMKIGGDLQYAHSRDPYAPDTIEVRDPGDYSAASKLRFALDEALAYRYMEAIELCRQAHALAPGYAEPYRVMGYVYDLASNLSEAVDAYQCGLELAPDSPYIRYFYGKFLVDNRMNLHQGLQLMLEAQDLDPGTHVVGLGIADANFCLEAYDEAIEEAARVLRLPEVAPVVAWDALCIVLQATAHLVKKSEDKGDHARAGTLIASAAVAVEACGVELLNGYLLDLCLLLEHKATDLAALARGDDRRTLDDSAIRLRHRRRDADPDHLTRTLGRVKTTMVQKNYGFLHADGQDYFFHQSALEDPEQFYEIRPDSIVAFVGGPRTGGSNPPANDIRWIF